MQRNFEDYDYKTEPITDISSKDVIDYQKKQIAYAIQNIIKMHSPGGRDSHETRSEQIISHLGHYCLLRSQKTGDYICLRGDDARDIEAVNRVCEDLNIRYADR